MINEIKERLEEVLNEASSSFNKDGYEVKTELEVSEVEDGYNTYIFPAIEIVANEEVNAVFGFTVEIDKNGEYNEVEVDSDIAEFIARAKEYANDINNSDDKCEAIRTLDARLSEEAANAIKAEAELTAKREAAAIKATYRQALIAAGVMAVVALVFFVISKLI